jgi:hypothetical protein
MLEQRVAILQSRPLIVIVDIVADRWQRMLVSLGLGYKDVNSLNEEFSHPCNPPNSSHRRLCTLLTSRSSAVLEIAGVRSADSLSSCPGGMASKWLGMLIILRASR